MLCIADGAYVDTAERPRSNPEHWLKPAAAMLDLFADLPEATANTLVVAQRCAYKAPSREPILPSLAGDPAAEAAQLADLAAAGPRRAAGGRRDRRGGGDAPTASG